MRLGHFERSQTAKKEHQCALCKKVIMVGEKYNVVIQLPHLVGWQESDGSYETDRREFHYYKACGKCYREHYEEGEWS